ncbi:MAG TPA: YceI family protein [Caldithrix abyssi]|uniref:YceI family protein n=1 Tax=Caldithrix abyssi TaxID=187145 RepID=A0A7V1PV04_CALAY|nr:YceI family protein [Caldithrix abyssi]
MRFIVIGLFMAIGLLPGGEWHVDGSAGNRVVFYSSSTLLDFKGETDAIDGYIYSPGDSLFSANTEVYFEVQPAFFNTGNGKRDRDMREDVLHTERYALSYFKGRLQIPEQDGKKYRVTAKGEFFLHGVSRPVEITGSIFLYGNKALVKSRFSVLLKDYNIRAPKLLAFVKVAEKIDIEIEVTLLRVK